MEYLFKNFKQNDQQTLFIIGNGFDIAHQIESKYSDFKKWCEKGDKKSFVGLMEIFFSNYEDVWSCIETALGHYDEGSILDYCKPNREFDYDHPTRSMAEVEDSPEQFFKPVLEEFKESYRNWVDSIDISFVKPIFKILPEDAKYL